MRFLSLGDGGQSRRELGDGGQSRREAKFW